MKILLAAAVLLGGALSLSTGAQDNSSKATPPDRAVYSTEAQVQDLKDLIAKARASYPSAKQRFLDGLPKKDQLYVRINLLDKAGRGEGVFVLVTKIKNGEIHGRIANNLLLVTDYSQGQKIKFPETEIEDWTIAHADGSEEGNLIGKYLRDKTLPPEPANQPSPVGFLAVGSDQMHIVELADALLGPGTNHASKDLEGKGVIREYRLVSTQKILLYFYEGRFLKAEAVKLLDNSFPKFGPSCLESTYGKGPVLGYCCVVRGGTGLFNTVLTGEGGVVEFPKELAANAEFKKAVFAGAAPLEVQMTPRGDRAYSPVPEHAVTCFKMVHHLLDHPEETIKDITPPRPYEVVGTLHFGENWYYDGDIQRLLDTYVAKYGGDDVLRYDNYQKRSQHVVDPALGRPGSYFFQSMDVVVIKYTGGQIE